MLVFVYGTLKRGFPNYHEGLADARFICDCLTVERWPMYIQGRWFAPAILPEPGLGHRIRGELFDVETHVLQRLDVIEFVGRPGGYHRREILVERSDSAEQLTALAYMRRRGEVEAFHGDPIDCYQDDRYLHRTQRPGYRGD